MMSWLREGTAREVSIPALVGEAVNPDGLNNAPTAAVADDADDNSPGPRADGYCRRAAVQSARALIPPYMRTPRELYMSQLSELDASDASMVQSIAAMLCLLQQFILVPPRAALT